MLNHKNNDNYEERSRLRRCQILRKFTHTLSGDRCSEYGHLGFIWKVGIFGKCGIFSYQLEKGELFRTDTVIGFPKHYNRLLVGAPGAYDEAHPCHWSIRVSPLPFLHSASLHTLPPGHHLLRVVYGLKDIIHFCSAFHSHTFVFLGIFITYIVKSGYDEQVGALNRVQYRGFWYTNKSHQNQP